MPGPIQTDMELRIRQMPPEWYYLEQGVPPELIPETAGKWIALVPSDEIHPTQFETYEFGFRATGLSWASLDVSTFYSQIEDRLGSALSTLGDLIDSAVYPGEQIIPIYVANLEPGESWGGETVLRMRPTRWSRLELSHSWVLTDVSIPGMAAGADNNALQQDDTTPDHIGRFRAYFDIPNNVELTLNGAIAGKGNGVQRFDYVDQKGAVGSSGVVLDTPSSDLRLDVTLEKQFGNGVSAQVWGRDLLNEAYVDAYLEYLYLGYPHTTGRSFGAALRYQP